ncbi:mucin-3B-like isoform X2 [Armigeres subalbatus]|uniref:mucin-3B-like isoform X2 n=1 Tax=Armigeres subalbatus TaxID=124917 RepID=UPI002ED5921B
MLNNNTVPWKSPTAKSQRKIPREKKNKKVVCLLQCLRKRYCELGRWERRGGVLGQHCLSINLVIASLSIDDGKLYSRWLDLNESITINQLELRQSEILEIPSGVFDARHFYSVSILTLDSLLVTTLPANIFLGLQLLQELNLKNLPLSQVDEYVLAPVKFTLTSLLVENCLDLLNPRVFTGATTMDNLAIVSFEYNIFHDVLSADSFSMVPSLSSLYLRQSHIRTLPEDLFASISNSIEQIHLDGNELTSIDEGVFGSLLKREVKLYLKDNPFVCDCDLVYLRKMVKAYPNMFDEITCTEPIEFFGWLVSEAEFCITTSEPPTTISTTTDVTTFSEVTDLPEDTTIQTTETTDKTKPQPSTRPTGEPTKPTTLAPATTTTTTTIGEEPIETTIETVFPTSETTNTITTTTPTPTTTTTSIPTTSTTPTPITTTSTTPSPTTSSTPSTTTAAANTFTAQCVQTAVQIDADITTYQSFELSLHRRSKTFTILESQEGAVELILDQLYSSSAILWFYDTSTLSSIFALQIEDSAGCAEILGRTVRISNLIPDKNYIFCVIYQEENTISPFDCLPHKLLPTYGQRTWLIEDQKITVISILIASVLVAIICGVVLSYCFIKSFDAYQKTCRKPTTEMRIDRSTTNQCYMTPVAEPPTRSDRSRHKRSVSESSIESCRSYVSAVVPPTQFQYISWKLRNRPRHSSIPSHGTQPRPSMEFYPKDPPPPPLPPHPTKRLKKQKSEIKINFQEIYDEPNSSSYTSSMHKNFHPGKH